MKILTIGIVSTLMVTNIFAQNNPLVENCSNLIISEILYGENLAIKESNQNNYALELYNPTEQPIDLSEYTIELNNENIVEATINLLGQLQSEKTYVIVHPDAEQQIITKADRLEALLDFENKSHIDLKQNGVLIDRIGREGVGTQNPIDINYVLNNPQGIAGLPINMQAIKGINLERRHAERKGNPAFSFTNICKEWLIYPSIRTQGLGHHITACKLSSVTVQYVETNNQGIAGIEKFEAAFGTNIVTGKVEVIGTNTDPIEMSAAWTSTNTLGMTTATEFDDFNMVSWNNQFTIQNGASSVNAELAIIVDDQVVENDEVAEFGLVVYNPGNQTVFIGFPDVFDIIILDDDAITGVSENDISMSIGIYPSVFDKSTTIKSDNAQINEIVVINIHGTIVKKIANINANNVVVNLDGLADGYYSFGIITSEGQTIKKGIKIN